MAGWGYVVSGVVSLEASGRYPTVISTVIRLFMMLLHEPDVGPRGCMARRCTQWPTSASGAGIIPSDLLGIAIANPVPRRLVPANFENASRIRLSAPFVFSDTTRLSFLRITTGWSHGRLLVDRARL